MIHLRRCPVTPSCSLLVTPSGSDDATLFRAPPSRWWTARAPPGRPARGFLRWLLGARGGKPETRPSRLVAPAALSATAHRCPLPHAAGHSDGCRGLENPAMLLLSPKSRIWSHFPWRRFSCGDAPARGLEPVLATPTRAGLARGRPGLTHAPGLKSSASGSPQVRPHLGVIFLSVKSLERCNDDHRSPSCVGRASQALLDSSDYSPRWLLLSSF